MIDSEHKWFPPKVIVNASVSWKELIYAIEEAASSVQFKDGDFALDDAERLESAAKEVRLRVAQSLNGSYKTEVSK